MFSLNQIFTTLEDVLREKGRRKIERVPVSVDGLYTVKFVRRRKVPCRINLF